MNQKAIVEKKIRNQWVRIKNPHIKFHMFKEFPKIVQNLVIRRGFHGGRFYCTIVIENDYHYRCVRSGIHEAHRSKTRYNVSHL